MRPHPRIRKTIMWGGICLAVVCVALIALTPNRGWGVFRTTQTHAQSLRITEGAMVWDVTTFSRPAPTEQTYTHMFADRLPTSKVRWWFYPQSVRAGWRRDLPLWMPALASLIAAGFAWRLDTLARRRERMNACPSCGYDRTGLAPSSPCPECGTNAPQA